MIAQDKRYRGDGRKARVIHVPLTDREFDKLRRMAFREAGTIGNLASYALRSTYDLDGAQRAAEKLGSK